MHWLVHPGRIRGRAGFDPSLNSARRMEDRMIYPKITKSRMVFDLNGIWDFRFLEEGEEYGGKNQEGEEFLPMPVPSSYNREGILPTMWEICCIREPSP